MKSYDNKFQVDIRTVSNGYTLKLREVDKTKAATGNYEHFAIATTKSEAMLLIRDWLEKNLPDIEEQ